MKDQERLRVVERKIVRRIMGTIKEDEGLRLLRNVEILGVLNGEDIVLLWQVAHKKSVDYIPTACAEEETITEEASRSAGPVLKATTMKAGSSKEPSKKKENED
ncbi:unnamed protein product [Acanthoscelides obtectus]|uniref:Uncharacterized protein n=1 Tax=Acanthoscelides obtectus TaxID=200917 RepID=A0A9P0MLZ7_ACAOB|nr:unnamed protein product [Acanthoscelides obtectus]CAK1684343.1 hypothetical protein AOBTE_LOCUS34826 [Acanthoscelides obtectus]